MALHLQQLFFVAVSVSLIMSELASQFCGNLRSSIYLKECVAVLSELHQYGLSHGQASKCQNKQ